jgi:tetratricopeptide repeat protein 21B
LEFEASASVGFKLAFCYLKSKQLVEAINICEVVLGQYADYPRITDEILRKAQEGLRTV